MSNTHNFQIPRMTNWVAFLQFSYTWLIFAILYTVHYADREFFIVVWNNREILWQLLYLLQEGRLRILNRVSLWCFNTGTVRYSNHCWPVFDFSCPCWKQKTELLLKRKNVQNRNLHDGYHEKGAMGRLTIQINVKELYLLINEKPRVLEN